MTDDTTPNKDWSFGAFVVELIISGLVLLALPFINDGNWVVVAIIAVIVILLLNFFDKYEKGNKHADEKMQKVRSFSKTVILLIVIGAGIYFAFNWGKDLFRSKSWALFLYSSSTPDTSSLLQRIDGYKNKTDCLEKGFSMTKGGSYECAYDCRYEDKYYMEICDVVCGQNGCRE